MPCNLLVCLQARHVQDRSIRLLVRDSGGLELVVTSREVVVVLLQRLELDVLRLARALRIQVVEIALSFDEVENQSICVRQREGETRTHRFG